MAESRVVGPLILTTSNRGRGIEGDIIRRVYELWTFDGKLVMEWDSYPNPEEKDPRDLPDGLTQLLEHGA